VASLSFVLHGVRVAVVTWLLLLCLPGLAAAQALYGSITGTVTDNSGASVPGVTVTITNEGTGLKLDTVSEAPPSRGSRPTPRPASR
jgi:hypothetical protein